MKSKIKALYPPFPWFGGKRRLAAKIWEIIGETNRYVEPFMGSCAVLLARPTPITGVELVNDNNHYIVNFYRALQADPEHLAWLANQPCIEADLHARHLYLVKKSKWLHDNIYNDPEWYNTRLAAWWVWGVSHWIGRGWCEKGEKWEKKPELSINRGIESVANKKPGIGHDRGVVSVANKKPATSGKKELVGTFLDRYNNLDNFLRVLSDRLIGVKVMCGDWKRVCTFCSTEYVDENCTIFLDPPYNGYEELYGGSGKILISEEVRNFCIEKANTKMKLILTGYETDHDELLNHGFKKEAGFAVCSMSRKDTTKKKIEYIWYKV